MNTEIFEKLNSRKTMIEAVEELVSLGSLAVGYLKSLFNGEATNQFGVPYYKLGQPLTCALEVIARIGDPVKELEEYVVTEIDNRHPSALSAVSSFSCISETSITSLANSLSTEGLFAWEAALILKKFDLLNHKSISAVTEVSEYAKNVVARVTNAQ